MTDPHPPALRLIDISVRVTDGSVERAVLDRVTLEVGSGELVAVMGPSGAGKSTLIDVACGLARPTAGTIELLGLGLGPRPARWWADRRRDRIGVVHQRLNLLGAMTALDNVALALDLRGRPHRAARRLAMEALDRAGIAHTAGTVASRLSIGEQQRVAIARAITGDRPLLLADEPAAALDRTAADQVTELLADLAAEGRAVLLVTHDSQQASWASRTVLLRDGAIVDEIGAASAAGR